jgi:hypothetical protein
MGSRKSITATERSSTVLAAAGGCSRRVFATGRQSA